MKDLDRLRSRASGTSARRGRVARVSPSPICFLLEKGLALFGPRCRACGREFKAPSQGGEKFKVALPFLSSALEIGRGLEWRLLIGAKVVLAKSNLRFARP